MLARCSSSFSIERSLISPKRHRDAMIESAGTAGSKGCPSAPFIQPSGAADLAMDRDDHRSPDWRRTRPLRVRVCNIDEPLHEYSTAMKVYSPVSLSRWYRLIHVAMLLFRLCLMLRQLDFHRQFLKLGNSRGTTFAFIGFLGFW
jgi:hypothetical protein